jgi:lipoyl-dependent peroxiredoxin
MVLSHRALPARPRRRDCVGATATLDEVVGIATTVTSALQVHGQVDGRDAAASRDAVEETRPLYPVSRLLAGAEVSVEGSSPEPGDGPLVSSPRSRV